jgi:hypothetical protein
MTGERHCAALTELSLCEPGSPYARLLRPLEAYLPFINANVRYTNDRLAAEIGPEAATPPSAVTYVPELVGFISLNEALVEMYRP